MKIPVYYAGVNEKPTEKQKKLLKRLFVLCRENGVSDKTGFIISNREDYRKVIDILVQRLKNAGVIKEVKR